MSTSTHRYSLAFYLGRQRVASTVVFLLFLFCFCLYGRLFLTKILVSTNYWKKRKHHPASAAAVRLRNAIVPTLPLTAAATSSTTTRLNRKFLGTHQRGRSFCHSRTSQSMWDHKKTRLLRSRDPSADFNYPFKKFTAQSPFDIDPCSIIRGT
jgi:hypothetical protein